MGDKNGSGIGNTRAIVAAAFVVALAISGCGGGKGGSDDGSGGTGGGGGGGGGGGTGGGAYNAGPGPQGGSKLYADFRAGKKLILHQRSVLAVTPAAFRDRFATMESTLSAFDGAFLRLPTSGDAVTKAAPLAAATVATDLEPLYALRPTRLKYNFAVVTVQNDLDPFDDWTPVVANFGTLAKVARDAGLVGIVIDNESLAGLRVVYPYDFKFGATRSATDYQTQIQANSKRIMQAITAEFPDAVVVVMRGPAGAEPKASPAIVNCESRNVEGAYPNAPCGDNPAQLLGAFYAGFVEAASARSLLVDGGVDYGLRTPEQFAASVAWRKSGLPSVEIASAMVPEALRAAWTAATTASFGVRELDGARGNGMPNLPGVFAQTLAAAMRSADHFVWASFDLTDMTKAAANNEFVVASSNARSIGAPAAGPFVSPAPGTGTGLLAQYFSQIDESELAQTIVDPTIENVWTGTGPGHTLLSGQNDNFSVVWTGYIEAPVTGTYTIFGTTDDGMQIFIDGKTVLDVFYFQGPTEHARTVDLVGGMRYAIKIRYFEGGGATEAHLSWEPPGGVKAVVPAAQLYPYR